MVDLRINRAHSGDEILLKLREDGWQIPADFEKNGNKITMIDGLVVLEREDKPYEKLHIYVGENKASLIQIDPATEEITRQEITKELANEWLNAPKREKEVPEKIVIVDGELPPKKQEEKPHFTSQYLIVGRGASGRAGIDDIDPEDIHDRYTGD